MTSLFALAHSRLLQAFARIREEDGQGTSEYAVLVVAVIAMAALVVGVITAGLQGYITDAINAL